MSDGGDLRKFKKALKEAGYVVVHDGGDHPGIYRISDGQWVASMAGSPSDRRSWPNFLKQLRHEINFEYRPKQTRTPRGQPLST